MSQVTSRYTYLSQRRNSQAHDATHCNFHDSNNSDSNHHGNHVTSYRNPVLTFTHFLGSPIQGINSEFDVALNIQQDQDCMSAVCLASPVCHVELTDSLTPTQNLSDCNCAPQQNLKTTENPASPQTLTQTEPQPLRDITNCAQESAPSKGFLLASTQQFRAWLIKGDKMDVSMKDLNTVVPNSF